MPSARPTPDAPRRPAAAGQDAAARACPPQGRLIPVAGRRVHVFERGDGPAVILIHGASGNLRDFTFDLLPRLAARYRVVAFDRPGLGHSDPLHDRGESPGEQARHLDDAAAAVGIDRAVIVGHSYGGAVAMAWALERPARAAAVVSLAGATMPWPGGLGPWYSIASSRIGGATVVPLISALAPNGLAARAIDAVFTPQSPPDGYAAHICLPLVLRPRNLRANARQLDALKPHIRAMAGAYPSLSLPVEVVHGEADRIVPLDIHGRRMTPLIPGARLTPLPAIGHMPHHADPGAAVAAIDRVATRAGLR